MVRVWFLTGSGTSGCALGQDTFRPFTQVCEWVHEMREVALWQGMTSIPPKRGRGVRNTPSRLIHIRKTGFKHRPDGPVGSYALTSPKPFHNGGFKNIKIFVGPV